MKIDALYQLYKKHYIVDTDTRNIRKNSLFFALKGTNFNGNYFAQKALDKGALFSIIDEEKYYLNDKTILVDNVLKTLQSLAAYHRQQLNIPIIGLTGSNGKTTTKELINIVLSKKYNTTAIFGNLNNHIGVPLTLLSMTPKTEIGIVEMGANHQKEIEFLCNICKPDVGYITNFGKAHLEGFGGIEGVIKGKSELYNYLKENSKSAIINPKDKIQVDKTVDIRRTLFNENIQLKDCSPFIKCEYKQHHIHTHLIGTYNFANICAAITFGEFFNINIDDIKNALESYTPNNNRSQIIQKGSNRIILDAYNANPTSMKAALESFQLMDVKNKTLILGDMFELGEYKQTAHQQIADLAKTLGFKNVFLVGGIFSTTATNFLQLNDYSALENYIKTNRLKDCYILIKGSRGMQLERILDAIN